MKFKILILAIVGLFAVGAVSAQTKRPKKKTPASATTPNDKTVYEPDAEMLAELQGKVKIVESKKDWAKFDRQSPTVNASKTRAAYTAQFPIEGDAENLFEVIVVHNSNPDKFFEIRGFNDFPWRPFSDFKWISDDVLQFEQWVNPNNGGRYQVNVQTGKVIAAGFVRSN